MKTSNGCSITPSRRLRGALVTLVGAILMSGAAVATPPTYSIVVLPELPGTERSYASDISDAGQIVGGARPLSASMGYGISWGATPYAPQPLVGLTPDFSATAAAVNDAGFVVGYGGSTFAPPVAVMWDPSGVIVELGDLPGGGIESWVYDINAFGVAVGYSPADNNLRRPVFWTAPGEIRRLWLARSRNRDGWGQALNDFGDIVGSGRIGRDYHAVRWLAGQRRMQDLGVLPGGADQSGANDINNAGQVVGFSHSGLGWRAVLWNSDGSMTDLGDIGDGNDYEAVDIDPVGRIVGSFSNSGTVQAFLWTAGDGMMDLYDLIDPTDPLRAQFAADDVTISAINASGLIVGSMYTDSGDPNPHAIVLVPQE